MNSGLTTWTRKSRLHCLLALVVGCSGVIAGCQNAPATELFQAAAAGGAGGGSGKTTEATVSSSDGGAASCVSGETLSCPYGGPPATAGVGVCRAGERVCLNGEFSSCAGEVLPGLSEDCATPQDDDCDGASNDKCSCEPGSIVSCYSGPLDTLNIGVCRSGQQVCKGDGSGFGPCEDEVLPTKENCSTDDDEDCDGITLDPEDGCLCEAGAEQTCPYTGPSGTKGVGACKAGKKICNADGTGYSSCTGEVTPIEEACDTAIDDDCDGDVNQGCVCTPGSSIVCYTGPTETMNVGACRAGLQTCSPDGTGYEACEGQVVPTLETCATSADDDCDGQTNEEGDDCLCVPGSSATCYTGPAGTLGVGACQAGTRTCNSDGTGYSPCTGEIVPTLEQCATAIDDNCNGLANEGCGICTPGATQSCYTGPSGTLGAGVCVSGLQTCNSAGSGWSGCVGEVTPTPENCATPLDENCDGKVKCVPQGWHCAESWFADNQYCDCDCGAWDSDCDNPAMQLWGCGSAQKCENPGVCVAACSQLLIACTTDAQCCSHHCYPGASGTSSCVPEVCLIKDAPCSNGSECCGGTCDTVDGVMKCTL